jgi:iron complex outermembrane recepter protein
VRDNYGGPSATNADNPNFLLAYISQPQSSDYDAYGLKVGYDAPWFSVTSATSYIDFSSTGNLDLSQYSLALIGVPYFTQLGSHVFSQELTLNSAQLESWRWSLGGFYRNDTDNFFQDTPIFVAVAHNHDTSKSSAVFGELTRLFLGGALELTGGLRYFQDREGLIEYSDRTGAAPAGSLPTATFDKLTPRAVLTWHVDERTTAYASYSEGFRSGGYNDPPVPSIAPGLRTYAPDTLYNYELGTKGSRWGGRVNFEAALYYIDWRKIQQSLDVPVASLDNLPVAAIVNGQSASGFGTDLALTVEPIDGLTLGGTFSTNDLKMDANVYSAGVILFQQGSRLDYSPKTTFSASSDYVFPLAWKGYKGRFSISANRTSPLQFSDLNAAGTGAIKAIGDPMFFTRARFSIESASGWTATIFGDNLNNEQGVILALPGSTEDYSRPRPRTIGVQLEGRL